jgi:hypothetical protein
MRVIIAGSRNENRYDIVANAIDLSEYKVTKIISGGCRGVDKLGEQYAKDHKIPFQVFKAEWSRYGKAAGPVRNQKMAESADALIAILYPGSKGTRSMIKIALKQGLKVFVYTPLNADTVIFYTAHVGKIQGTKMTREGHEKSSKRIKTSPLFSLGGR